jgi:CheY-like chemotaxis protein
MRILLIEDDDEQARFSAEVLKERLPATTVEVIPTESAFRAALPRLVGEPPDIAIIDVMLRWADPSPNVPPRPPDVTRQGLYRAGLRVQKMLEQNETTRHVPVILYTALDPTSLQRELSECPPNVTCLSKRSDPQDLVRLVRSMACVSPELASLLDQSQQVAQGRLFISYSHRDSH